MATDLLLMAMSTEVRPYIALSRLLTEDGQESGMRHMWDTTTCTEVRPCRDELQTRRLPPLHHGL